MTTPTSFPARGASDPEAILADLSAVLDGTDFDPPIRYALAVVLLASEVRATMTEPVPLRLQQLIGETLRELRELKGLDTPKSGASIVRFPRS